jgi:hypothetical protein
MGELLDSSARVSTDVYDHRNLHSSLLAALANNLSSSPSSSSTTDIALLTSPIDDLVHSAQSNGHGGQNGAEAEEAELLVRPTPLRARSSPSSCHELTF